MDDLTQRYYAEAEMRYLREAGKEFATSVSSGSRRYAPSR